MVATYQKFSNKNFTVLGVSPDCPGQRINGCRQFMMTASTWTHVSDLQFWNNAVAQQYRVQSIPQNFLIGLMERSRQNLRGPELEK